ncbi:MAG: proteasome assembly chaperone family protein [Candidatus Aenigmarchaeota archaeon ex4484_56]|nr:MAG: proteasome assembly chaperone family protein [Candidatus Aenigmarchaeota archaeon ex4484_56]
MQTYINFFEKPKLKNPVLIEGLPGVGNVGRVAIAYMIDKLKAKKFAEIRSPYFMPLVLVNSKSEVVPITIELYFLKNRKRDIILLIGDSQPVEYIGYFELCNLVIELCEEFGVSEIITTGGYGIGVEKKKPRVLGAVTDTKLKEKYKKYGIYFEKENQIGSIFGMSGSLLDFAKQKGIDGCAMLGETIGYPILTDPKAAEEILKILMGMFDLKIDLKDMDKSVKQLELFLKNIEEKTKEFTLHKPTKNYSEYIG